MPEIIDQFGPVFWPNYLGPIPPAKDFNLINNSTHKWTAMVTVNKTGTLERIHFEVGTVRATSNMRASFRNVTTGTHGPDQTPDGTDDEFVDFTVTASTDNFKLLDVGPVTSDGTSGGTRRSVTIGDVIAVVFGFTGGSPDLDWTSLDDGALPNGTGRVIHTPKLATFNGSSWTGFLTGLPIVALEYDDGTFVRGNMVPYDLSVKVLSSSPSPFNFNIGLNTTPDEIGIRFVAEATVRVVGFWGFGQTQDTRGRLYDDQDNILATALTGKYGGTQDQFNFHHFDTAVTIERGKLYRLTHAYLDPTAAGAMWAFNVPDNKLLDALPGGTSMYWTERTDAGAWTDINTQRPQIGLIVDGVVRQSTLFGTPSAVSAPVHMPSLPPGVDMALTGIALNGNTDRLAFIFQANRAGTIDTVGFVTGAHTTTETMRVSLQDVTAAGLPDGTVDAFRTISVNAGSTWFETGLLTSDGTDVGTKKSVNVGDMVAVVFDFTAGTPDFEIDILQQATALGNFMTFPAVLFDNAGGGYTRQEGAPSIAVKMTSGNYMYGLNSWKTDIAQSLSTATTPDEIALRFKSPVPLRVVGAWFEGDGDDFDIRLLSLDNDILASIQTSTFDLPAGRFRSYYFDSAFELSHDVIYRLSIAPRTTTARVINGFSVDSNAILDGQSMGTEWYWSERTDAGAWTDDTTKRPLAGLIVDQFYGGNMSIRLEDESSTTTVMSTELNSLADNARALGAEVDNSAGFIWGDFEINVTFAVAPTNKNPLEIFILQSLDGTNFADGSASVEPASTLMRGYVPVRNVTSAQRLVFENVLLPPRKFKVLLWNKSGQAFPASGSTVVLRRSNTRSL